MKTRHALHYLALTSLLAILLGGVSMAADDGLVGHWKLTGDCQDSSGRGNHGVNHGVRSGRRRRNVQRHRRLHRSARLGVARTWEPATGRLPSGSIPKPSWTTCWATSLSKYDPGIADRRQSRPDELRRRDLGPVELPEPLRRHRRRTDRPDVDRLRPAGQEPVHQAAWRSTTAISTRARGSRARARPATSTATKAEPSGPTAAAPIPATCVSSLAELRGQALRRRLVLQRPRVRARPESPNKNPGGKVYRYEGGPAMDRLRQDRRRLHGLGAGRFPWAVVSRRPATATAARSRMQAMFRYDGGTKWTFCGDPGGRLGGFRRLQRQSLRHASTARTVSSATTATRNGPSLGIVPETTQAYSTAIHQGHICIGTWPNGIGLSLRRAGQVHRVSAGWATRRK